MGGEHLHRLLIQGGEYGISYPGGPGFRHDARAVQLHRFGWRVGERFTYEYDFFDEWCHDVWVEAVLPALPDRVYPRCDGGRRAGPPEDCGGPAAFLELRQYWSWQAPVRVAEILGELLAEPGSLLSEHQEALAELGQAAPATWNRNRAAVSSWLTWCAKNTGMPNTQNTPAEAMELDYPLRVWRYELRPSSGGAGMHPGSDGLIREVEVLADCTLTMQSERREHPL